MVFLYHREAKIVVDQRSKVRRAQFSIPPAQTATQYSGQVPEPRDLVRHPVPDSITGQGGTLHISNYKKVHYDVVSDVMVLQVNTRGHLRPSNLEAIQR